MVYIYMYQQDAGRATPPDQGYGDTDMTYEDITAAVKAYNASVAYGSECNAWQDYVADVFQRTGDTPWSEEISEDEADDDFAAYWLAVASGESDDYDAETGAHL